MKKILLLLVCFTLMLSGCAASSNMTAEKTQGPQLLKSSGNDFFVYSHLDRLYVVGSTESSKDFAHSGHLPYTRTILGGGPQGETVVFEIDKKNPDLTHRLEKSFAKTPFLIESNSKDYFVYKLDGRIFVIGQAPTSEEFSRQGHLPYTRTMLGAGPQGETVVFEVDKKNPALVERLQKSYL